MKVALHRESAICADINFTSKAGTTFLCSDTNKTNGTQRFTPHGHHFLGQKSYYAFETITIVGPRDSDAFHVNKGGGTVYRNR
jgi:hypothetical protein